jgi:hypothetical protein
MTGGREARKIISGANFHVGAEILVESNRLADSQPLHHYETESIAKRVKLVPMRSDQRDRSLFIVTIRNQTLFQLLALS